MKFSYVYILTNKYRTTFYIGVTANLPKRLEEHYHEITSKFTKKYNTKDLIYFETFSNIEQAIAKEKQLKNWHKEWKLNLINTINPTLKTLDY
ncbi:putative endonuclease [Flaviramulus basaltis]|uniref:Putative endonuclease n=1 Tax=Flaviramulus basaltis TaxID=369401 RepID=A0A1K2IC70_9FLAO|nr:GIY-YIG nuclease family protein [Flaviramulus basaltis]SFZ89846.1 putative endonuclease [Flaviramulus basaltis]